MEWDLNSTVHAVKAVQKLSKMLAVYCCESCWTGGYLISICVELGSVVRGPGSESHMQLDLVVAGVPLSGAQGYKHACGVDLFL